MHSTRAVARLARGKPLSNGLLRSKMAAMRAESMTFAAAALADLSLGIAGRREAAHSPMHSPQEEERAQMRQLPHAQRRPSSQQWRPLQMPSSPPLLHSLDWRGARVAVYSASERAMRQVAAW